MNTKVFLNQNLVHKQGEHEEEKEVDQDSPFVFRESMLNKFL